MMATVPHVTSGSKLKKFQADGFLLDRVYKSRSSLCNFLQLSATSSLLGPNIILSTLFSQTISQFSSLNVRDQVKHAYKTRAKLWFRTF